MGVVTQRGSSAAKRSGKQWLHELAAGRPRDLPAAGYATTRRRLWVAAERLAADAGRLHRAHRCSPRSPFPQNTRQSNGRATRPCANCVRSRLSALGPVTAAALAAPLGLDRGATSTWRCSRCSRRASSFRAASPPARRLRTDPRSGASAICSPASTATRSKRLRREIEPVEPRDFVRFLFDWQHLGPKPR